MDDSSAPPGPRRVGEHLYRVEDHGRTCGWVEEVGRVYVALVGPRYDRCVEVAQTLTLERATSAVLGR